MIKRSLIMGSIIGFVCILGVGSVDAQLKDYPLSLEEASQLALENSFDIQLAQYDVWIARTQQGVAESIYDTVLNAQISYSDDQRKRTSTIFGTKVVDNDYNVGLSKKLPSGTTIDVDLRNNRNSTNSSFSTSPLTHDSSLGLGVTQALGKNFFGLQDRGAIKLTRLDIEKAQYLSLEKIENHLADVQKAYWDLVMVGEIIKIEEGMLKQAKRLYDLHKEKLEDGLIELPEVIASEANYRERINELILAQNNYQAKTNTLKLKINIPDDDIGMTPTTPFVLKDADEILVHALKNSFENRQDYKTKLNEVQARKLELILSKNDLWPEINLSASLTRNGLGDHFQKSLEKITAEDNPLLVAGLTISFPLENTQARAKLDKAQLENAKSLIDLKLIERIIAIEIMDQVRNCNVLKDVAVNGVAIADLQAQKMEQEQKRFNRGRSDTDTVIRFQEDLLQAKRQAVLAKKRYHDALTELRRREGTLLSQFWDQGEF